MTSARLRLCLTVTHASGVLHLVVAIAALLVAAGGYISWLDETDRSGLAGLVFVVILPCLAFGAPMLALGAATFSSRPALALAAGGVLALSDLVAAVVWSGVVLLTWREVDPTVLALALLAVVTTVVLVAAAVAGMLEVERERVARHLWLTRVLVAVHGVDAAVFVLVIAPIGLGLTGDGFALDYVLSLLPALVPLVALAVVLRTTAPVQVHRAGLALAATMVLVSGVGVAAAGAGLGVAVLVPAVVLGVASYDGVRSVRLTPQAH